MKNHINKVYYTPYQLKLPPKIEKIIEISDSVYTFNEVFRHIDLNKHLDGTKITANANKYSRVWKKSSIKHRQKVFNIFIQFQE